MARLGLTGTEEGQHRQAFQVAHLVFGGKGRAGDQHAIAGGELLHGQRLVAQFGAGTDGDVDLVADQVHRPVADHHLQLDQGMARHEGRQDQRQHILRGGQGRGQPDHAARGAAHLGQLFFGGAELGQDFPRLAVIMLAHIGQAEMAGRTFDQPHAEPLFQPADMAAQGGFGQAKRAGGGGEALILHHGREKAYVVQILHGSP